jgi:orotate phosphoribosyltransferase
MREARARLLDLLLEKSYIYRPDQPFKLASGQESPYYVNCKPVSNNAEGMNLIGEILFDMIRDLNAQVIGGLTMGADPIAHAVSLISFQKGMPIHSFTVRKKAKDHGVGRTGGVEGDVQPGGRAVVIDDVITTGGSTIQAIDAAEDFGLEIVRVLVLVDRESGGKKNIEDRLPGVKVEPVFTLSEFKEKAGNP